jgi:hypothetical protein
LTLLAVAAVMRRSSGGLLHLRYELSLLLLTSAGTLHSFAYKM